MDLQPLTPERRRQQTREHLLAAAAEVFAERGFHGASLDEVAAVAGFTKGAVYSNFKNKEDLFLALFQANYDREMEAIRAITERLRGAARGPDLRLRCPDPRSDRRNPLATSASCIRSSGSTPPATRRCDKN